MKTYSKRDSATAMLKKLGIAKENYNLFITTKKDGTVLVDDDAAVASLASPKKISKNVIAAAKAKSAAKAEEKATAKDSKKALKAAKASVTKRTVSSVARELILKGKSNIEVYEVLVDEFELAPEKKYYPAWYRNELRHKGHNV